MEDIELSIIPEDDETKKSDVVDVVQQSENSPEDIDFFVDASEVETLEVHSTQAVKPENKIDDTDVSKSEPPQQEQEPATTGTELQTVGGSAVQVNADDVEGPGIGKGRMGERMVAMGLISEDQLNVGL